MLVWRSVPIMPTVYEQCGYPAGAVDFLFWQNRDLTQVLTQTDQTDIEANVSAHHLSVKWLSMMGLM